MQGHIVRSEMQTRNEREEKTSTLLLLLFSPQARSTKPGNRPPHAAASSSPAVVGVRFRARCPSHTAPAAPGQRPRPTRKGHTLTCPTLTLPPPSGHAVPRRDNLRLHGPAAVEDALGHGRQRLRLLL